MDVRASSGYDGLPPAYTCYGQSAVTFDMTFRIGDDDAWAYAYGYSRDGVAVAEMVLQDLTADEQLAVLLWGPWQDHHWELEAGRSYRLTGSVSVDRVGYSDPSAGLEFGFIDALVIPEPDVVMMLALGAAGAVGLRRR